MIIRIIISINGTKLITKFVIITDRYTHRKKLHEVSQIIKWVLKGFYGSLKNQSSNLSPLVN